MPAVTDNPTVLDRLNAAAAAYGRARDEIREAAKALHDDIVPSEVHRDALFAMDTIDDRVAELARLANRLAGRDDAQVVA